MLCNNDGIMAMHQLSTPTKFGKELYSHLVKDLVRYLINNCSTKQYCPDGFDVLCNDAGDMAMHRFFTPSNFI